MHALASLTVAFLITGGYSQSPPGVTPATAQHLTVKYGSLDLSSAGITVQGSQTTTAPCLAYNGSDSTYLAVMIDLSVQVPQFLPRNSTLLHWMLPGLSPSSENPQTLASDQTAIAPYIGPSPPPGQTHTYEILLFKQPANFSIPTSYVSYFNNITASTLNRIGFDITNFTAEAKLEAPVAANWFLVGTPNKPSSSGSGSSSTSISGPTTTPTGLVSIASLNKMEYLVATVALLNLALALL